MHEKIAYGHRKNSGSPYPRESRVHNIDVDFWGPLAAFTGRKRT